MKARVLLILLASMIGAAMAGQDNSNCDSYWENIVNSIPWNDKVDKMLVNQLIDKWEKNETACENKELYSSRLATLYMNIENFSKARLILNEALTNNDSISRDITITMLNIDINEIASKNILDKSEWRSVIDRYAGIIQDNPDWYAGYYGMGNILVRLGKFEQAEKYLTRSIEIKRTVQAYRNLALVYANLKDYNRSINVLDIVVEMDNTILHDKEILYAASLAHLKINRMKGAKSFLILLLKYYPSEQTSKRFLSLIEDFKEASS